jgi:hypothetical protein
MIDYSKWPRRRLSVVNLKLDDLNPRLPGTSSGQLHTQPKIIEYLIEHEGVYELAKGIATQGYLLNEDPIVCKEGNRLVVLEGNRRVAACKLLVNPDLVKSKTKRKVLIELLRNFDLDVITKMEVRVAPDRDSADVLIVNRHTDGTAIERWDKTKQDRFFFNRVAAGESIEVLSLKFNIKKSVIKDTLIRYNMYNELLEVDLDSNQRKDVEDETKFAMTNVERFYTSKLGKEFLGLSFTEHGSPVHNLPKDEYKKRLRKIVLDVVGKKLTSRTYGDDKDQKSYVESLNKESDFNLAITPSRLFQAEYTVEAETTDQDEQLEIPKEPKAKTGHRETPSNKLIASDCIFKTNVPRIDLIFKELKAANLDTQFNSSAVLFRSYIDMLAYQFLAKHEAIKDILSQEQQKRDAEFDKKYNKMVTYLVSLGVADDTISQSSLIKAMGGKPSIRRDWIPSLKQMLVYIAKSETLIPDARLQQALNSYVKGNDSYLDHNDFNLLVHNEYYLSDPKSLKEAWSQLFPLITYMNQQLSNQP